MPRITIKSPDEIRREVNSVKQQQKNPPPIQSRYKRRTLSTDLTIDFGQCPRERILDAGDLATLISCAPGGRLESLSLEHCRVVGDFALVLNALRTSGSAQHLKTFSSYACKLRESTEDMIAMGEALATLPKITGVSLGLSFMKHQPAWKILTPIVQNCKKLNKIFVNGFYAPPASDQEANQKVVQFFQACGASQSIQRLLCLPMLGRAFGSPAVLQALGQLLRQNSSLQTLELYILNGTPVLSLAEDLKHNTSLTRLALIGRHESREWNQSNVEMQAFSATLQVHNYVLRELCIEPWHQNASPELEFELSLNRMGRQKLLTEGAVFDEWMEAIANKDNCSAIYYFLRKNPNLCDPKLWTNDFNNNSAEEQEETVVDLFRFVSEEEVPRAETPQGAAAVATAVVSPESPLVPRMLHSRRKRKRSREEMEQEDDEEEDTKMAPVVQRTASAVAPSMLGVVTTTAYTAAVFAAGYWFRGAAHPH